MHGSGTSAQETAAVRLYLDDSGSSDPGTPDALLGGMLINYRGFHTFEDSWQEILDRHKIISPLHMKEFGKDGRLGYVTSTCRFELFSEIAELINSHKLYSMVSILNNAQYKKCVAKEVQKNFSFYGMCFLLMVMLNHKLAEGNKHTGRIPFILDTGNPNKGHVVDAHAEAIKMQRDTFMHLGGLHFEDDRDFGILQAADVIAWSSRRKSVKKVLPQSFSPLERILTEENGHIEKPWTEDWLSEISKRVMKRYELEKAEADENKK
jgi:hypothetical protein